MNFPEHVVGHSTARTAFEQGDFVGDVDRSGFCASLSFAWCRQIQDSPKGSWSVPTQLPAARLLALRNAAAGLIINQRVYGAKQQRVREVMARIPRLLQVSNILARQGFGPASHALEQASRDTVDDVRRNQVTRIGAIDVPNPFLELARDSRERVTAVAQVPRFKDVAAAQAFTKNQLAKAQTYVLGIERFHAIAVYRTGGVISTDFYFFDPNCGEFKCSGSDEAGFGLFALLHTVPSYAEYRHLFVYQVAAT